MRYAFLLDWGSHLGVFALVISFAAYLLGILSPHVPLEQLPGVWSLPVATYLERTATPTGWGWLALAGKGDLSNLIGIALLAGCSLPPLLALIPLYLKRRDYLYAGAMPIAVFLLAWVFYVNFVSDGNPAPLPYVPLLNPLDLAQAGALLALAMWYLALTKLEIGGVVLPSKTATGRLARVAVFFSL